MTMNSTRKIATVLMSAMALSACTLGPQFQRPNPPSTLTYTNETLDELRSDAGQQIILGQDLSANRWHSFGSEPLEATIRLALAGNRNLAAAQASLAQARETVNASVGTQYPQVQLDAGAGREKYGAEFGGPQYFPPFTYFAVGPSVSYLFDYLGGERRAVEQQRALAEYQSFQLQATYLTLAANVVQQALAMASARAQIDEEDALLAEDRKNLALVQASFDAGSGTRVDVLTAQSQLAADQTALPPLRQQLSVARHALSILVGRAPADWTPPDFTLSNLHLPQTLPLSLPSELVHRRPDILAAESQLHAATAAVGVAESRLYPQITLTASESQQSLQLSHVFDKSSAAFSLATGITAPLFDGGTRRAQRRAAQYAMQAALANYEQTVLQSFGQIADVLTALEHDAEQLAAQQHAIDFATASLKLTRESYRVGNVGVPQVLDAERLYQRARIDFVRAEAQRFQDTAQLFLTMGGPGSEGL